MKFEKCASLAHTLLSSNKKSHNNEHELEPEAVALSSSLMYLNFMIFLISLLSLVSDQNSTDCVLRNSNIVSYAICFLK